MCKAIDVRDVFGKFYELYLKNKLAAKVTFDAKKVCLSGIVDDVDIDDAGQIFVALKPEKVIDIFNEKPKPIKEPNYIVWQFDKGNIDECVKLRCGKKATLEGAFNSYQTQAVEYEWIACVHHCRVVDCETE